MSDVRDGRVRLTWWVDQDGYKIERRKRPEKPLPLLERHDRDVRLNDGLWLSGLLKVGQAWAWPWESDVLDFIVPIGGKRKQYEAELLEHPIYLELANSKQSSSVEDGVLKFVNKWGSLWHGDAPLATFVNWRNKLIEFQARDDLSQNAVRHFRGTNLGRLNASFEVKRGTLQLYFQAETLQQFCVLEVLQAKAGFIDVTACGACNRFLPLHKNGRPKQYCDDRCKTAAYRMRKNGRSLPAE